MTALQQKAIRQAIKLLEETRTHTFYAENYTDAKAIEAAARRHNESAIADECIKSDAVNWLRAALETP